MDAPHAEGRPATIDVQLDERERQAAIGAALRSGLRSSPPTLPRHLLLEADATDLDLQLDQATAYYPARSERALAEGCARLAFDAVGARSVVALGPTPRGVVDAVLREGAPRGVEEVVLVDARADAVRAACTGLGDRHRSLRVHGRVADPRTDRLPLPDPAPRLVVLSGLLLGALAGRDRSKLWQLLAARLAPGDAALIAVDLLKDRHQITRAYDDPTGIQSALTFRALATLRSRWGAEVDPGGWEHGARWDERTRRVTVRATARSAQRIAVPALDVDRTFPAGSTIELEQRTVFLGHGLDVELSFAGLGVRHRWTTADQGYAMALVAP